MKLHDDVTGTLRKGDEDGAVTGFLVSLPGARIEFTGFRDPRPGKGYTLIGKVVSDGRAETEAGRSQARMADDLASRSNRIPVGRRKATA